MSIKVQKDKIRLNKVTHEVRASQAILQYGVGAMVDFPEQTLMTAAPEYWKESVESIHDERLEKLLHVMFFGALGNTDDARYKNGISYVRFPEWYFCPACRRFQPISDWIAEYRKKGSQKQVERDPYMLKHPRCPACRQDLVVARIVTVCEHGHIDDFPWVKWVHSQSQGGAKRVCNHPSLRFITSPTSSEGLEGLTIRCENCSARATLSGAFDPEKLIAIDEKTQSEYGFRCTGRFPWKNERESCSIYPKVLQRGSSSVYFPVIASSLVIPPYSSRLTKMIEESSAFDECKNVIVQMMRLPVDEETKSGFIDTTINDHSKKIALEISVEEEKVLNVLRRKWQTPEKEENGTSGVKYRAEEYEALSGEVSIGDGDYDTEFVREETNIADYGMPFIHRVSLIHKIKEVQALIAYSRLKPVDNTVSESSKTQISIKEPGTDWYPAYQVRGEGIFVEFDSDAINRWRNSNTIIQDRVNILNENWKNSFIGSGRPRTITSKFLFLHTLSHLLIKQLSFECGYSIASLRERIYCSEASEGKEMAGILIYTASGDSEGTLGGLVRQGRADVFPLIFKKAVESAMTCSNDPVCSLSTGQGRDSLNMSACYSCTLIPETSCEEYNVFLDRGTIIGTYNHPEIGFFSNNVEMISDNRPSSDRYVKKDTNKETNKKGTLIIGEGTDMHDISYEDIWNDLLQWSDDETEKQLLGKLAELKESFSSKEKPIQNAHFRLTKGDVFKEFDCDLIWNKSKVAFFTVDNQESYHASMNTDWTCLYGGDAELTPQQFLEAIKEEE